MKRLLKKATAGLLTLALVAGGVPAGTISEKIDSVKEAFVAEADQAPTLELNKKYDLGEWFSPSSIRNYRFQGFSYSQSTGTRDLDDYNEDIYYLNIRFKDVLPQTAGDNKVWDVKGKAELYQTSNDGYSYGAIISRTFSYDNDQNLMATGIKITGGDGSKDNQFTTEIVFGTEGKCGENAYYAYDPDTETLTISGSGAIWSGAFINYSNFKKVVFAEGSSITEIGSQAFKNTAVEEVDFLSGVTSIGDRSFENSNLKSITLPSTLENIGKNAFYNCSELTSVDLSACIVLSMIDDGAFQNSALTSIYIPGSVKECGTSAFQGCASLATVTIGGAPRMFYGDKDSYETYYHNSQYTGTDYYEGSYYPGLFNYSYIGSGQLITFNIPAGSKYIKNYNSSVNSISNGKATDSFFYQNNNIVLYEAFEPMMQVTADSSKLYLKIYVPESEAYSYGYTVTYDGEAQTLSEDRYQIGEKEYRYFVISCPAKEMSDIKSLIVTAIEDGKLLCNKAVSVKSYMEAIRSNSSLSAYHDAAGSLLRYGAAAQTYFEYNTDKLANKDISDYGLDTLPSSIPNTFGKYVLFTSQDMNSAVSSAGVTYYGMNMSFVSDTTLLYAFEPKSGVSINDALVNVRALFNGAVASEFSDSVSCFIDNSESYIIVKVANVPIKKLENLIFNLSGLQLSAADYLQKIDSSTTDTDKMNNMKLLVRALYKYYESVKNLNS